LKALNPRARRGWWTRTERLMLHRVPLPV
jgi:hypothetical protein